MYGLKRNKNMQLNHARMRSRTFYFFLFIGLCFVIFFCCNLISNSQAINTLILRPNGIIPSWSCYPYGDATTWECVDDITPDGNTTYVYGKDDDINMDRYTFEDHAAETGTIHEVELCVVSLTNGSDHDSDDIGVYQWASDGISSHVYEHVFEDVLTHTWQSFKVSFYRWYDYTTWRDWTWSAVDNIVAGISVEKKAGSGETGRVTQVYLKVKYSTSFQNNVYVDDDYTPATPGWNTTRFNNIHDAVFDCADGGTVHISDGIYTIGSDSNHMMFSGLSGRAYICVRNKAINIVGTGTDKVFIDVQNFVDVAAIYLDNADGTHISGISIVNVPSNPNWVRPVPFRAVNKCDTGIVIENSDDVILTNIIIIASNPSAYRGGAGILIDTSDNVNITDIYLNNSGLYAYYTDNIYIKNVIAFNQSFFATDGGGIGVFYGNYVTILDSYINMKYINTNRPGDGIYLYTSKYNLISNNTLVNGWNGITTDYCNYTIIQLNYIYNVTGLILGDAYALAVNYDKGNAVICNNTIYKSVIGIWYLGVSTTVYNITINDNYVNNCTKHISEIKQINDITIYNNLFNHSGSTGYGMLLYGRVNNATIHTNIFTNVGWGIYIYGAASWYCYDNLIYNNYFEDINVQSAYDAYDTRNRWNISKTAGTNILGGQYLGGNYWDDYTGNDTDDDGLGDTNLPYNASSNITFGGDYHPLVEVLLINADFTYSPSEPYVGDVVSFTDTSTGIIVGWYWQFGDGGISYERNPKHSYSAQGGYLVTLEVRSSSATDRVSKTIIVQERILDVPRIPLPQTPLYPFGYTIEEIYSIICGQQLPVCTSPVTLVIIDSGVYKRDYNNVTLSQVSIKHHPFFQSGVDEYGHGTFVNYEIAYLLHLKTPYTTQISYKAFAADGTSTETIFLESLETSKQFSPDVVTISAGIVGNINDVYVQKIKELHDLGIIVVSCAAGNYGPSAYSIISPACSKDAVAVGASDPVQTVPNPYDDFICLWSSRGPVEGLTENKPDLVAPGESIQGPWGATDTVASGTSFATPLIAAGTCNVVSEHKLLIDVVKFFYFWNLGVVPDAYEDALEKSCIPIGDITSAGAGIIQLDQVSYHFFINLLILLLIPVIIIIVIIILIVLIYRYRDEIRDRLGY